MSNLNFKIHFLVLSISLIQCKSIREGAPKIKIVNYNTPSARKEFKSIYTSEFKLTYFRRLLGAGFNHSKAVDSLITVDASGFAEPILSEKDLDLIDSLVYIDNQRMEADSSNRNARVPKELEGKRVFSYILFRLENKWLDSLARSRYKHAERKSF